jgi:hypothetical protein
MNLPPKTGGEPPRPPRCAVTTHKRGSWRGIAAALQGPVHASAETGTPIDIETPSYRMLLARLAQAASKTASGQRKRLSQWHWAKVGQSGERGSSKRPRPSPPGKCAPDATSPGPSPKPAHQPQSARRKWVSLKERQPQSAGEDERGECVSAWKNQPQSASAQQSSPLECPHPRARTPNPTRNQGTPSLI